jgi:hypothetical protein
MRYIVLLSILTLTGGIGIAAQDVKIPCPSIKVVGPPGVTRLEEKMAFTAEIGNFNDRDILRYEWTISSGRIESGQGTSSIVIPTSREMNLSNITATVKISGLGTGCPDAASETAGVAMEWYPTKFDEFEKRTKDELKARFDNFYIAIQEDPAIEGLIAVELSKKDTARIKSAYLRALYDAILWLKKDLSRVTFLISEADAETRTVLWPAREGFDIDLYGNRDSKMIKGEEFSQKIKTLFAK